jgi:hypothetical protein
VLAGTIRVRPSAAEADIENKTVIAAVNRCATQNQDQSRVFPQPVKPAFLAGASGTSELMPFPNPAVTYSNSENALMHIEKMIMMLGERDF